MDRLWPKFVWPDKCSCIGVNVAPMVEMLNVSPVATRAASLAQASDQSPQTFNESLVAATKASSSAGAAYQAGTGTGRRQKPASQDTKPAFSMSHVRAAQSPSPPQKTVQQQVLVAQQQPLINPAPMQLPLGEPGFFASAWAVAAGQPMPDFSAVTFLPNGSKLAQPVVANSDSGPSSHAQEEDDSPQAASVWPLLHAVQTATNLSNNGVPNPGNGVPNAVSSTALPGGLPSAVQNVTSPVALSAIPDASSYAAPAAVSHDAVNPSARGDVASKSSSVSASQANQPAGTPDPSGLATGLSVPVATADQLVALIQPGGGLLVAAQASASSVSAAAAANPSAIAVANGKDGANTAVNNAAGLKRHVQAASDLAGSQTVSQGTAQSGDQSQGDAPQQGQSAASAQVNFANHIVTAVDHAQNGGVAAPLQTAATPAGVTGHTAKTADIAAPATIALPQAVPVINTAKLIQSMGQTEMRVGMRSNDFGNISISTTATRDLISAQISLDHGELARTLAAHLPEMQARLGGNQTMDVRIDMNGQATGQGAGTSPGMSNGSQDGSRGERQQKGSATSSQPGDGYSGQGSSTTAAGLPSGEGRLDARLDIKV